MRIRALRERMGMTAVQLGDAVGVTFQAVYKWERGEAAPSADKLPALADALHCTIDALYGREPPTLPPEEVAS